MVLINSTIKVKLENRYSDINGCSNSTCFAIRGGLTIWKLGHCPRAWGQ
ncbi:unnamed protein product [Staurois parvus]|uniref:Uncharacterized protein n=1 Tax=Staurois parvus TaxID=386267 RepID=A0ABN9FAL9_9NEOB|nr:unnamed protein product [Staurois parvus]